MMAAGSEIVLVARMAGIARLGNIDKGRLVVGKGDGDVGDGLCGSHGVDG